MTKKLYKFLNGMESKNGSHEWEKGKWYSVEGELEICKNGFHASEHIQDALNYVQADTLAAVEVDGEHIEDDDKQCWERMRVVKTYEWTRIESMKLAIYSAKESKEYFDGDEEIIDDCIDVAGQILNEYENGREPSEKLLEAAWSAAQSAHPAESSAARSAAKSAAWSAWSAARSSPWSAARSASWSASWSAKSAESVKKDIHEHCLEIVVGD